MKTVCIILSLFLVAVASLKSDEQQQRLVVVTVASEVTDGFERFNRSIQKNELKLDVLGLNLPWQGGDMNRPGGGYKINLLADYLKKVDNDQLVIMFVDSYDVLILTGEEEILEQFNGFNANVVIAAERAIWPDPSLAVKYPNDVDDNRYLNSGAFIGYAKNLLEMTTYKKLDNQDDDQLYLTKIFIDDDLRQKWSIKLDHHCKLFQNLFGFEGDVELRFDSKSGSAYLYNLVFETRPTIIHGNGLSKNTLNSLGNYLVDSWTASEGCLACNESQLELKGLKADEAPLVLVGIFVKYPTAFIDDFFDNLIKLKYPKKRIHLFIHNQITFHNETIEDFSKKHGPDYLSLSRIDQNTSEAAARTSLLSECGPMSCDFILFLDSDARLTNPRTLVHLIQRNKKIIAPMLSRHEKLWSNFWGALSDEGFYARAHDYVAIVNGERRGIWNVPYISQAVLINATSLSQDWFPESGESLDMVFPSTLRAQGRFMFVDNLETYGHLVDSDTFDTSKVNPDLYEIYSNKLDWEARYIHANYSHNFTAEQPCPDVYWFPLVTKRFTEDLVAVMNAHGGWSDGSNDDTRLAGGYENVPTRDIHMNQVGYEQHWLYFLREYVRPMQEAIFTGYYHDPPKAIMNFVVRYHPEEQASLRPHHDASTYTINVALNQVGVDYEGGGCRFLRYNCSVTELRQGWTLMHPGRLTHYHEGLAVTSGVRYIMISFVDP